MDGVIAGGLGYGLLVAMGWDIHPGNLVIFFVFAQIFALGIRGAQNPKTVVWGLVAIIVPVILFTVTILELLGVLKWA